MVLTYQQAAAFIKHGTVPQLDGIQKQIMKEICYFTKLHPIKRATLVHYDRTALFGKEDKSLRITFDRNLTADTETDVLETQNTGKFIVSPDTRVMEIKIAGAMPLWLAHVLAENKIYSGSFSKIGRSFQNEIKHKVTTARNFSYSSIPIQAAATIS